MILSKQTVRWLASLGDQEAKDAVVKWASWGGQPAARLGRVIVVGTDPSARRTLRGMMRAER